MAPKRGEAAEERREGDTTDLGEKIFAMEVKFSTLEATVERRLGSMEEMLRQLVEAQTRAQISLEKGKGPNPNPNPIIHQVEEEESLVGGAAPPPIYTGEATWKAPANGGERIAGHLGRPHEANPRRAAPWAGGGLEWAGHMGPAMGGTTGCVRDGSNGHGGWSNHLGPAGGGPTGGFWQGVGGAHYGSSMEGWGQRGGWEHEQPPRRGNFIPSYRGGRTGPLGEAFYQGSWGEGR